LVTGQSLLQGYARMGRWLVWTTLAVTVILRHSSNLYTVLLIGNAAHLLAPLPLAASAAVWTVLLTILGVGMMIGGGYPLIERACKVVIVILGVTLPIAALLAHPDPAAIAQGMLIPKIPEDTGLYGALLLLAAMIGAQAGSMSNLSYSYFTTEKGWRGADDLPRQRRDLLVSTVARFAVGTLLQVAAAATLMPRGIKPSNAEQLVRIFGDSMGLTGKIIFGVGLLGICFSSFVGGTMGYSLIVRDICRRFVPGMTAAADAPVMQQPGNQDPIYRWSIAILGLSPLYIVFLHVEPVALTLLVRSMVVIVIPLLVGALVKIVNDGKLMGKHRPGWFNNLIMVLLVVVSLLLMVKNAGEWWQKLTG